MSDEIGGTSETPSAWLSGFAFGISVGMLSTIFVTAILLMVAGKLGAPVLC